MTNRIVAAAVCLTLFAPTGSAALAQDAARQITVEMKPQTVKCSAEIGISYGQKNTIADVDGELNNAVCAASSGEYTLSVTTRDANGELKTTEFRETWQRSDDQTVHFTKEYPIDENVDLVRVRAKRVTCVCAEAAADATVEAAAETPAE